MADDEESGTSLKIGGFNISGVVVAVAVPVLSGISGAVYFGYDALSRFNAVEQSVEPLLDMDSRLQALEQAIADNDVRGLSANLTNLSTQMTTILEQQRNLLDLRSKVERAELITNGIDDRLQRLQSDIDSTWNAIDALEKPL
jgi:hypothetical protein